MVIDSQLNLSCHFFLDGCKNLTLICGLIRQLNISNLQGVSGTHCVKAHAGKGTSYMSKHHTTVFGSTCIWDPLLWGMTLSSMVLMCKYYPQGLLFESHLNIWWGASPIKWGTLWHVLHCSPYLQCCQLLWWLGDWCRLWLERVQLGTLLIRLQSKRGLPKNSFSNPLKNNFKHVIHEEKNIFCEFNVNVWIYMNYKVI